MRSRLHATNTSALYSVHSDSIRACSMRRQDKQNLRNRTLIVSQAHVDRAKIKRRSFVVVLAF
jgi:hypothetical protein